MTKDDTLVLNALDERLASWGLSMQDRVGIVYFGRECAGAPCFWYERGGIFFRRKANVKKLIETREMKLAGVHNYQNACAAAAMAWSRDIAPEVIADGLYAFGGLPHRLEFVKEYKGVRYYNDSKATTAESVIAAVSSFGQNVRLIAGGRDKGCDFSVARDPIGEYVKSVHLIGEASGRIAKEWKGQSSIAMHASLEEALNAAREAAVGGDVVVLSPGCSSFDMFASYEQRGDVFKSIVEKWTKEESDE
jgi:UDP-N-acetylmuramoylalanine--D-glutamate ligase